MLAGQINAANRRLLKLIAEFDRRKGWSGGGTVRSFAHWLNWKCGIALVAARQKCGVAHCLETLPQIDSAFAAGEISYSKVRAMTRVATPAKEDYLLFIARQGTAKKERFQQLLTHTRADALVAMSEHFLATYTREGEQRGLTGSERCQVILHVDINTLRHDSKGNDCAHEHCHLHDKSWLTPDTARRLACDASLVTMLEDEKARLSPAGVERIATTAWW